MTQNGVKRAILGASTIRIEGPQYAAVRENETGPWVDMSTRTLLLQEVQEKADATDRRIPHWAEANPVVGIVELKVEVKRVVWEQPIEAES